jgi:hypothetical protein
MKNGLLLLVFTGLFGCAGERVPESRPVDQLHMLQVSHHHTIPMTRQDAQLIVDEMSAVIAGVDDTLDVECRAGFELQGDPEPFHFGTGIINSAQDFRQIYEHVPGQVKVVNMINYCGRFGSFLGCALTPGDSLLVVRPGGWLEGVLWAHEYGHNQGLAHRSVSRALMNPVVTSRTRNLNRQECEGFVLAEEGGS